MSNSILTYSQIKFYPLNPVLEDIKIEDIAHALSLMTRANGHFHSFYSVAQHSINCSKEAQSRGYSERVQLACLLHDASECYLSDITRPVKRNLSEYCLIEERLQNMIYHKFGIGDLSEEEQEKVKEVDDALLHIEFETLMGSHLYSTSPYRAMEHDLSQRDFVHVEKEFLVRFHRLMGQCEDTKGHHCVGIDGCKEGWVAVSITGTSFEIDIFNTVEEICTRYPDSNMMIIDVPIGLPESREDIRPEGIARGMLKGKSSSIFNPPCRQAVYANSYNEANDINRKILGKGLSKQSYMISGKMKEIDEFLHQHPQYKNRLLEGHPELCFASLNDGETLIDSKKTYCGIRKRIEVLSRYYESTEAVITYICGNEKLKKYMDDVVDALCLAITGMISKENGLKRIPENLWRINGEYGCKWFLMEGDLVPMDKKEKKQAKGKPSKVSTKVVFQIPFDINVA